MGPFYHCEHRLPAPNFTIPPHMHFLGFSKKALMDHAGLCASYPAE